MMSMPWKNVSVRRLPARLSIGLSLMATIVLLASCQKGESSTSPLNSGRDERSQIVVISDIHLGANIAFAEMNQNRGPLADFLDQVRTSPTVKELVIAGDLLDEWFVPATTDTYAGKGQADFVGRIVSTNQEVFDAFQRIIQEDKILVTYVPGNHDLAITAENIESVLPGIHQAREDVLGLGTYSPEGYPEIAIEHGHRYNIFCAPDPLSNAAIAPGSFLPPGYFYTRIATLHVIQKCKTAGDTIPEVTPNAEGGDSQALAYAYWQIWKATMEQFPIENKFDEKIILTNINGFTETYAVNDLMPFQETPGGLIDMKLFKGSLDQWDQRQTLNNVAVHIPTMEALAEAPVSSGTDVQAARQYFTNTDSNVRLVVFGHTHDPKIQASDNHAGLKSVYVNSGTWIDKNPEKTTMNFVVITPQEEDATSLTDVKLYSFEGSVMTELAVDSLRL